MQQAVDDSALHHFHCYLYLNDEAMRLEHRVGRALLHAAVHVHRPGATSMIASAGVCSSLQQPGKSVFNCKAQRGAPDAVSVMLSSRAVAGTSMRRSDLADFINASSRCIPKSLRPSWRRLHASGSAATMQRSLKISFAARNQQQQRNLSNSVVKG